MLERIHLTGNDGYQNFLVFASMLISIILDSNKKDKKVTYWISSGISSEKNKPFDSNFKLTIYNLANGRVILKFNNSVLVQKSSSILYSNIILNLCIAYELNNWLCDPTSNFPLNNCLFDTVKLVRNAIKCKFTYNGSAIAFDREVF